MGTRNLTVVVSDGEYKIAQYGQWDGYPSGNGVKVLSFLADMDVERFKEMLNLVRFATEEDGKEVESFYQSIGVEDDWMNVHQAAKFKQRYPLLSRDVGADILSEVYTLTEPTFLINNVDFVKDSLFCEWAYLIDLDKGKLEVYTGCSTEPPFGGRFVDGPSKSVDGTTYYPVNMLKEYDLTALPSESQFLLDLEGEKD